MIGVKSGFVTLVKNETMALFDVPALFTTSIPSSIKDSTSTFNGSYGCYGQSDQLHSFEAKNYRLFQLLTKETEVQHVELLFYTKSVGWQERNRSLGCMNLKMRLKSFFKKTISTSNFTMKGLLLCLRTWPVYSVISTT